MRSQLFFALEAEFCPPLDISLLVVLLSELEHDDAGNTRQPTPAEIATLRIGLCEMAAEAELSQQFENIQVAPYTEGDESSVPSMYFGVTATSSSASVMTTPLGFLQAALPHIDTDQLDKALADAQMGAGEMDMWDVVANILTAESIREMEERGLDGVDDEGPLAYNDLACEPVKTVKATKKKKRKTTIALADIRQQHHIRPQPVRRQTTDSVRAPDTWSQLASLSTHVSSFVPTHEPAFFQSYFHSPQYPSPYAALCAALSAVRDTLKYTPDEHIPRYLELLNIILPMYDHINADEQSRMVAEAELCVIVTGGQDSDALELVSLLRELDSDCALGYLDMGVYHSPQPSPTIPKSAPAQRLPAHPPPITPPSSSSKSCQTGSSNKPSPYQWQAVQRRKGLDRSGLVFTPHVSAYTRDVNGIKVKGPGNFSGNEGEIEKCRRRMGERVRKRDEMLREATRSWQKGSVKSRGGDVALFFAERARQFQEMVRKDALELALMNVKSKRTDWYTVDLHGTTAAEAIYIVRDLVSSLDVSSKPFTVITGRGSHSVNQVSVLKPAVRKALTEDGYTVSSWDGGLYVRSKR